MVNAAHGVEPVRVLFYLLIIYFYLANALFYNMTMILELLFKTAGISSNQLYSPFQWMTMLMMAGLLGLNGPTAQLPVAVASSSVDAHVIA